MEGVDTDLATGLRHVLNQINLQSIDALKGLQSLLYSVTNRMRGDKSQSPAVHDRTLRSYLARSGRISRVESFSSALLKKLHFK